MTREEIKKAVLNNIEETSRKRDSRFTQGKLAGMITAFKMAGMLDENDDLIFEIMNEL